MPFALVTLGLIMIVVGAKDTQTALGQQLLKDFTGTGNFTYWVASIGAVGALGYVDSLRTFSRSLMFLILLVMIISNRGVFAKLTEALSNGPVSPAKSDSSAPAGNGQKLSDFITSQGGTVKGDVKAQITEEAKPRSIWDLFSPNKAY